LCIRSDRRKSKIDASSLTAVKKEQCRCVKGVYGWYILVGDLKKLGFATDAAQEGPRIYLYVGTVTTVASSR
jgi:hypothetical protein